MADYKLSYTASEINEKLGKIGQLVSWNDLTDKPFYTEGAQQELLPATTLPFALDTSTGIPICAFMTPPTSEMVEMYSKEWGKAIVMWDGSEYECEPKLFMGIKAIGNVDAVLGIGDSGEPFAMLVDNEGLLFGSPIALIVSITDTMNGTQSATHNVGVSLCIDKIHPIDSKFINNIPWENISNKPFETILAGTIIADEEIVARPKGTVNPLIVDWDNFIVGVNYSVTINDDIYTAQALQESNGVKGFGIYDHSNGDDIFLLNSVYSGFMSNTLTEGETYHIKIAFAEDYIKPLNPSYLEIVDYAPSKILVNDHITFIHDANPDISDFYAELQGIQIIGNKQYMVALNGEGHIVTAIKNEYNDGGSSAGMMVDTSEGRWLIANNKNGASLVILSPYNTAQSCSVYIKELEVYEIKEKYLPTSLYTYIDNKIKQYVDEALGK